MKWLVDLFTNPMIIIPLISWLTAQILKTLINALVMKKFKFERLFGDGGMPSGHSATVFSLATICAWSYGFGSIYAAITGILAIIVMHDASGVRLEAGKQATQIKKLAEIMNGMFLSKDEHVRTENLKEFIGHTPIQVVFGAILGFLVSLIYLLIVKMPYAGLTV